MDLRVESVASATLFPCRSIARAMSRNPQGDRERDPGRSRPLVTLVRDRGILPRSPEGIGERAAIYRKPRRLFSSSARASATAARGRLALSKLAQEQLLAAAR